MIAKFDWPEWYEWPFALLMLYMFGLFGLFAVAALFSIPYFAIFPERHRQVWDFYGTPRQREALKRRRSLYKKLTLAQRIGLVWQQRSRPKQFVVLRHKLTLPPEEPRT